MRAKPETLPGWGIAGASDFSGNGSPAPSAGTALPAPRHRDLQSGRPSPPLPACGLTLVRANPSRSSPGRVHRNLDFTPPSTGRTPCQPNRDALPWQFGMSGSEEACPKSGQMGLLRWSRQAASACKLSLRRVFIAPSHDGQCLTIEGAI
jgi:hypothetical protein